MDTTPQPDQRLIEAFSRLPGIGPKSASRLTYYLIRSQSDEASELSDALRELREKIQFCSICFNITEHSPCPICQSEERDRTVICVVEEPLDVMAIERTGPPHHSSTGCRLLLQPPSAHAAETGGWPKPASARCWSHPLLKSRPHRRAPHHEAKRFVRDLVSISQLLLK